ncbi:hypothetical protein CGT82_17130 [Vibrio cholerae]|nr:hypothetical protein CGT82_17130 [Vibrio cholerae]
MRTIFNAPYSLCRRDGLTDEQCKQVSLYIGGDTFRQVFISKEIAEMPESYFRKLNIDQAKMVVSNYILENNGDKTWRVPTLGQLTNMIRSGYIPGNRGHKYWYRSDSSDTLKIATYNSSAIAGGDAALYRLATSDLASSCTEDSCDSWTNIQNWTLQTATASSFAIRYNYGYTHSGRDYRWSKQWGANNLLIPGDATKVWIEIWHNGSLHYSGKNYDIEKSRGTANIMCIKQFGSLAVHHSELRKGACW